MPRPTRCAFRRARRRAPRRGRRRSSIGCAASRQQRHARVQRRRVRSGCSADYAEIATVSRSQHRSQGQGALPQRGPRLNGVRLEASRVSNATAPESGTVRRHRYVVGAVQSRCRSPDSVRARDRFARRSPRRRSVRVAEPHRSVEDGRAARGLHAARVARREWRRRARHSTRSARRLRLRRRDGRSRARAGVDAGRARRRRCSKRPA